MELRCHHCGRTFTVPVGASNEVRCPACGVMLLLHPPSPRGDDVPHPGGADFRPHHHLRGQMRRIFSPVPNAFVYLVGILVVLTVLAPFWLAAVSDRVGRKHILIDPEVPVNLPPWSETNVPVTTPSDSPGPLSSLDQFQGVRLDAPREALERRFTLHLKNTRGMSPEIYEAADSRGIEKLTGNFYNGELKEFVVVLPARKITPDEILRELRAQYGDPQDWSNAEGAPGAGIGQAVVAGEPDRYAKFNRQQKFLWSDEANRFDATVYYTTTDPTLCESLLVVHVAAARWLETNRPALVPPPTNPPVQVGETLPAEEPKRLFP